MKRIMILVLLVALAICSFGDIAPTVAGNDLKTPVTLRLLNGYPDYNYSFISADIVGKYNATHPGINLVVDDKFFDPNKDFGVYDVLFLPAFNYLVYENTDKLLPLNDLSVTKNNLYKEHLPINGNIYALPSTSAFEVVWYRKSIFTEYNISIPQTWDEFIKVAKTIRDGKKYIPIAFSSNDYWSSQMFGNAMPCLVAGNPLWDGMMTDESPYSKSKPYYTALNKIKQLAEMNLVSGDDTPASLTDSVTLFRSKQAAMLCWKEYLKQHFDTSPGSDFGCFFLPVRGRTSDTFNITANIDSFIMVLKDSSNSKEAKEFINWFFTSPFYPEFLSVRGYTSTVKGNENTQFPVIKDALESAGENIKFVTPTITSAAFDKRISNSGIYSYLMISDIFAGRDLDNLVSALNKQWVSGRGTANPAGYYAATVAEEYTPPEVDYDYTGPGIQSVKDVNTAIDASIILNADYPHAYAYTIKTRLDSENKALKPVIKNNCMMVPINFLRDGLGAAVDYKDMSKIKISYNTNSAVLSLNKNTMSIGNETVNLVVAPQMIKSVLYVPINGLAENLFNLKILNQQKTAIVYYEDMTPKNEEVALYFDRANIIFKNDGLLRVTVDPRVELLKIMELLGKINSGRVSTYDSTYRREVVKYFAPYINHPSIQLFKSTGLNVTVSLMSTLMSYSAPPGLTLEGEFSNDAGFNQKDIEPYVEAMRQFAKDTSFINFYEKNYCIYRSIIQNAQNDADKGTYIRRLTDYYGSKLNSYNTILAPLLVMVSCGPHVTWDAGKVDTYNIVSSLESQNDIPWFGAKDRLMGIIWHEYGHSYVNSLTDSRWNELKGYAGLVEAAGMPSNYGNDWMICVNEHIVRAVTARLILQYSGFQAYRKEIESQKQQGFVYIEDICNLLADYEKNRVKYPQFKDFYGEFVELFKAKYQRISSIDIGSICCFGPTGYAGCAAA